MLTALYSVRSERLFCEQLSYNSFAGKSGATPRPRAPRMLKAGGPEARLYFGAHALMENRHGLCADFTLHNPIAQGEPAVALAPKDRHRELNEEVNPQTVGADKGYPQQGCRARAIAPHVACKAKAGLDPRRWVASSV